MTRRVLFVLQTALTFAFHHLLGNPQKAKQIITRNFTDLGGLYIKFLQLMALQSGARDLNTGKESIESLDVFDAAPFEYINLRAVLGRQYANFDQIADAPFAAGSFAQVYDAVYRNKPVIIKVLRPSVQQYLKLDLKLLSLTSWFAARFVGGNSMVNFHEAFKELRARTLEETDYVNEAANATELKKLYAPYSKIFIPETFLEVSSESVLVQEKIHGVALTSFMKLDQQQRNSCLQDQQTALDAALEELATATLHLTLNGAISHGDPHPGNIFIMTDNRIGLIDFGNSNQPVSHPEALLGLMQQNIKFYQGNFVAGEYVVRAMRLFSPTLFEAFSSLAATSGDSSFDQKVIAQLEQYNENIVASAEGTHSLMTQNKILRIFTDIANGDNQLALEMDHSIIGLLRSTHIYMKLIDALGFDKGVVERAYQRVVDANQQLLIVGSRPVSAEVIDYNIGVVCRWLDRLRYQNPSMYTKIIGVL